ncbi:MAG: nucleotidyl transferase AbiEii/AbiGii toxin family protein [Anaerolineales bacterium]
MSEHPRDMAASIHGRLVNEARKLGRPFGEILQYYGMERFLYRLSKTEYADNFILKGGLVFHGWQIPLRRPTKDMDFLGLLENQQEGIVQAIEAAISVSAPEDDVNFDLASLVVEVTQVDADRKGIRASFLGYLGRARIPMQIDFGFSDEITSEPVVTNFPTLLQGMVDTQIRTYPVESVVAEKFHAMQRYADIPSRWKDYYDVWLISESFELDDRSLQRAVAKTFEKRDTIIPVERPISLTVDFATKYRRNWLAFLKKSGLENSEINDLSLLIEKIWVFLEWPLHGLAMPVQRDHRRWTPGERKWK